MVPVGGSISERRLRDPHAAMIAWARDMEDHVSEDSERCGRCDRSAIEADDLDNWIANGEGQLVCPGCQTQQERIAGARSSLEGLAHLTRLRERRSQ